MASKHPGFKAVQSKIEGEGYSPGAAGAILASSTRNASPAAKRANPRLKRVKGGSPPGTGTKSPPGTRGRAKKSKLKTKVRGDSGFDYMDRG